MKREEAKRVVEACFERWGVPRHLTALADIRGGLRVTCLPVGEQAAVVVDVPTGRYEESAKAALDELERLVRANWHRTQLDVEDMEGATSGSGL